MASRSAPSGRWCGESKASDAGLGISTERAIPDPSLETRCGRPRLGRPRAAGGRSVRTEGPAAHGRSSSAGRRPQRVGRACDPDRDGGRPRPRQPGLHRALDEPHRRTSAGLGAQTRPVAGARVPTCAPRFGVVDRAFHRAAIQRAWADFFHPRPAVAGGRPVPGLEGHGRNSRARRSRRRARGQRAAPNRSALSPASSRSS